MTLSSSHAAAVVPASVTIPSGATNVIFQVNTTAVDTATEAIISATAGGVTRTATLAIAALPAGPDATTAVADRFATVEDVVLVVPAPGVLDNDTDADGTLTAELVDDVAHGRLTLNADGSFTFVPDDGFAGTDTFTYRATDGTTHSNTVTVTISVTGIDAPVAADDTYTTAEDAPLTVAAPGVLDNDTDPNGDTLTAALVDDVAHGRLTLNADGAFVYTPSSNFNGRDTFTYRANDGSANSNTATVTITVTGRNDAPEAADDTYTTAEETPLTVAAPGVLGNDTDADGDALTAALVDDVAHGTLTLDADGAFTYVPDDDFEGTDTFTYRANDGTASGNTATVTVTVTGSNDAPTISDIADVTIDEDASTGPLAFTVGDAETSVGSLTVSGSSSNTALVPDGNLVFGGSGGDRMVTITPAADQYGSATITVTVSDGSGAATDTFTLTVNQVFDDSQTFTFTGTPQNFSVPTGVTSIQIEAFGAEGGDGDSEGGYGGGVTATVAATPGEPLAIFVGGQGGTPTGGFNGGASGGDGPGLDGGGGGGASDVRQGGTGLADRIVVAGGGGGGGAGPGGLPLTGGTGGAGGDLVAGSGGNGIGGGGGGAGGGGGRQDQGGAGGAGSDGGDAGQPGAAGIGGTGGGNNIDEGGGGGGGYFGGGGGGEDDNAEGGGGGGGGSSFTIGTATDVTHQQGVRAGDGLVIVRW